jgi:hypothetical protein
MTLLPVVQLGLHSKQVLAALQTRLVLAVVVVLLELVPVQFLASLPQGEL